MTVVFEVDGQFGTWRAAARRALARGLRPEEIEWRESPVAQTSMRQVGTHPAAGQHDGARQAGFDYGHAAEDRSAAPATAPPVSGPITISRDLADRLAAAALYRDPRRWAFLYRVIWRWQQGERDVASPADPDGARLNRMVKAVRRDKHDMIAYLRFIEPEQSSQGAAPRYFAWYAPHHHILSWAADYFAQRMATESWLIATPDGAVRWDGTELHFDTGSSVAPDLAKPAKPDDVEDLWLTYYRHIFNPARLNQTALERHLAPRIWSEIPEGKLIPTLIRDAERGARRSGQATSLASRGGKSIPVDASQAQPERADPSSLDTCRRCELWRQATQAVPGRGPRHARIMLLGEQPGDQEDLAGEPFVGPAGQLLDRAMERAGLPRGRVYVTNAVKHFKWEPRGKRRLHKTPAQREIDACAYWLEAELQAIQPKVVVALGATALNALLHKKSVSVSAHMTEPIAFGPGWLLATYHPSYALRQTDDASRERVLQAIATTLTRALELAESA